MNVTKENKIAGFFIRFASLLIDVVIFSIIGLSSSLMCLTKVEYITNKFYYAITQQWTYYVWLLLLLITLSIQFIAIPLLSKGKTIGMLITRLELKSIAEEQSIYKTIVKRINIGVFLWIFMIIIFMAFVNTKIINKMSLYSKASVWWKDLTNEQKLQLENEYKLTILETSFFTIPSSLSTIILFGQLFMLISVGANSKKIGIADKLTDSIIVYKNIFIETEKKEQKIIEPIKHVNIDLIWKE